MEIIIFCGIQASGKTTFFKDNFMNTHCRISLDLLKTRHREEAFINLCISTKMSFVVDNTNPSKSDRLKYISLAKSNNCKLIGYYFQSKIDDSLQRNSMREGIARIPDVGIKGTFRKLEIPSLREGFDELYYVEIIDHSFLVKTWVDEMP